MKWLRIIPETLIIFALVLSINNYFGNEEQLLNVDGKGYYDYLPALFIYGDLPAFNKTDTTLVSVSERINKTDFYVYISNNRVNKYPCGVAVLLFPSFIYAHLTARLQNFQNDGFSLPYQKAVFYSALIYLFLVLIFLRKLLSLYLFRKSTIFIIQIFVVFATSIIHYTYADPGFSHIYSFFAITAFLYFVKSFFTHKTVKDYLWACVFLGLIVILRQLNIIVVLFIPFMAGSFENLKSGFNFILSKWLDLIKGILIFIIIVSIQIYLWHFQTGKYIVDSYPGESFNFLNPHFFDILFSYQKGLFVYAPILLFSFLSFFYLVKEKKYYLLLTWLFFFVLLTYILSSWWAWYYGSSYGLRAYIDFYAVFCILLGFLIQKANNVLKIILLSIMTLTIPLNFIQTLQYKRFILLWNEMDKRKYWDVFLKTDLRFQGYLWKKKYDFKSAPPRIIYCKQLGNSSVLPNITKEVRIAETNNIINFNDANLIEVSFDNDFNSDNDAHIEFFIQGLETYKVYLGIGTPVIHFAENGLNKQQAGKYIYELPKNETTESKKIFMKIVTMDKTIELKNIKVNFLKFH